VAAGAAAAADTVSSAAAVMAVASRWNVRMFHSLPAAPTRGCFLPPYGPGGVLDAASAGFLARAAGLGVVQLGSAPRTTLIRECAVLPLNGCSETSIRE
jgi:hypothetical protein